MELKKLTYILLTGQVKGTFKSSKRNFTCLEVDIIVLRPTWLHPRVLDNELYDNSFQIFTLKEVGRHTDVAKKKHDGYPSSMELNE